MSLPNRVIGGGVRRLPQVNMTVSTSLRNRYISGANVGGVSTSNRRALKLRAEHGFDTNKNASLVISITNPLFQTLKDGIHFLNLSQVRSITVPATQVSSRQPQTVQTIGTAWHSVPDRISLVYINDVINVTEENISIYVSWILVYDEGLTVDITSKNFDKNIHFGYFSSERVSDPTKLQNMYVIDIRIRNLKNVTNETISIQPMNNNAIYEFSSFFNPNLVFSQIK